MKKLFVIIFALFAFVAQADNVITSKEYVDTQAGGLQEQISANDANTVLTYTDTAGTVGEKKIYDSSAAYNEQVDSLVTAGAFNTAIQNALETEFICVDWLGDVHDNAHCLLYKITAVSYDKYDLITPTRRTRQLFNRNADAGATFDTNTKISTILIDSNKDAGNVTFGLSSKSGSSGNYINGHKYYFRAKMRTTTAGVTIEFRRDVTNYTSPNPTTEWRIHDGMFTADFKTTGDTWYPVLACKYPGGGGNQGVEIDQNTFSVYDLTAAFGAGNEPATPDAAATALGLLHMPANQ